MVLYLIGLGLGDAKDITVRGLEIVRQCDLVFLESYTSVFWLQRDDAAATEQQDEGDDDNNNNHNSIILNSSNNNNNPVVDPVLQQLQDFYDRHDIQLADRDLVESHAEQIYQPALTQNVAFLVVGDPVAATTHMDLTLRAKEWGVRVECIHNASIMTACGACGLQLYHFGQTVSLPFWDTAQRTTLSTTTTTSTTTPITSWYSKIASNRRAGLHTLCLLDIQMKEPDYPLLAQTGKLRYLPPRFMTVSTAAQQLLKAWTIMTTTNTTATTNEHENNEPQQQPQQDQGKHEDNTNETTTSEEPTKQVVQEEDQQQQQQQQQQPVAASSSLPVLAAYDPNATLCVGVARLGHYSKPSSSSTSSRSSSLPLPQQRIVVGTLQELALVSNSDDQLGPPLHSLMICGLLHELEVQALQEYLLPNSQFQLAAHQEQIRTLMMKTQHDVLPYH